MKRLLAACAVAGLIAVGGCTTPSPTPTPVPSVSASDLSSEAPTVQPTTARPNPEPTKDETKAPTVAPTSSEAGTPEVQFVKRWGMKYPAVQEYVIQKAANGACKIISVDPDWTNNADIAKQLSDLADTAGMQASDGFEFAQDAELSYCPSQTNPT